MQGISNPDEIHIASANYYIYESKLIGLKEQYRLLQNNIQLMVGQYLQKKEKILYQYPCDILEINSDINATLLERRIDVLSAKEKILSSKSRLKSDKKIFFPNINLTTSAGYASSNLEELINDTVDSLFMYNDDFDLEAWRKEWRKTITNIQQEN